MDVPYGIAVDSVGNLYIAEYNNHRVRKITPDGKISTVAGNGSAGSQAATAGSSRRNWCAAAFGGPGVYVARNLFRHFRTR
ncbi:SBBP repeat-containing protein [Streptomyces sp. NPDC017988]|uniref:SBBP repeat-containing protein n=1 Tax=Streptomyces sp. NPDC017988 TaxID=3365025 RepID=UPI0037946CB7